jgi:hypothetical protein
MPLRSYRPALVIVGFLLVVGAPAAASAQLRPPSVPLVAVDPYFSIWSAADRLTDVPTKHWTGRLHRLTSFVRIDGKAWRVMGDEPAEVAPMKQKSVEVKPTRLGKRIHGAPVIQPDALPAVERCPIVVSVAHAGPRAEIRGILAGMGFVERRDYLCAA